MTQVTLLLIALTGAPATAGQVVSGPGYKVGQAVKVGQTVRAPTGGAPVAILTRGGCLLRLIPGSRLTLTAPSAQTRCTGVRVLAGRVRLLAPGTRGKGPALTVSLGVRRLRLTGEALARNDGVQGLCVRRGKARLQQLAPPATAPATAPTPAPTSPPSAPPRPVVSAASKGQCLWLTKAGTTRSTYAEAAVDKDRKAAPSSYGYPTPKIVLSIDLKIELASLTAAVHSGAAGGSDVEGGGQSMCLETGSEGSAADLGSSSVEVTKPPPPTQLRLILTLQRRTP